MTRESGVFALTGLVIYRSKRDAFRVDISGQLNILTRVPLMKPHNLLDIFAKTVEEKGHTPCFRYKAEGTWITLYWDEIYRKVCDLAGGLRRLGIHKGDRVSIFSQSCYRWTVADLAILACGAVSVPIYQSSLPEQAAYILNDAEVKVVFVENAAQLKKIQEVRSELPNLNQIILFDGRGVKNREDGVYFFDDVLVLGSGLGKSVLEEMTSSLIPEDEASYVYTSGTTGPPKGAILTHGNFISELKALEPILESSSRDESLMFLPLAHIIARVVQFAQIQRGFIQCYAESIEKLLDNLVEVKPHFMASVPRIFEKVHTRVMQGVEASSEKKKKIFNWALSVGKKRWDYIRQNKRIPLPLKLQWGLANQMVFSKLHQKLGGRSKFFISGGAPLSPEISEFFHAAGFKILEGYGLTETTAAVACSTQEDIKIGSVGKPLPGIEIKIAPDGEILVRGGVIFKGYFNRPEATKEVLEEDGWFHTGDIGIFDDEGFLKITDRKKDIIVTAGGKNIAPQNIENLMKADPLISQIMVHGDKRKFLSALVTLDPEEVKIFAKSKKIPFQEYADLVKNKKIYNVIQERIEDFNQKLPKYETVKKIAILENDFSIESGELTPTLKVKRKFTSEKYKDILDSFYQEAAHPSKKSEV